MRSDYWARRLFLGKSTGFIQSPPEIAHNWLTAGRLPSAFSLLYTEKAVRAGWSMFWRMSPTLWFGAECSRMRWRNSVFGSFVEGPRLCVWQGKTHWHSCVRETTTASGVVMIFSVCAIGCEEDGSSHFSCQSIFLPQRENSVLGTFLFLSFLCQHSNERPRSTT